MRCRVLSVLLVGLIVPVAASDPIACSNPLFEVDAPTAALARQICADAATANAQLRDCEITLNRTITLAVVDTLPDNCFGQFHCGTDRIEIAPPADIEGILSSDSIYRALPPDTFYRSLIVHEVTHAATDAMPCPFENCIVGQEYLAYAMQFLSLPGGDRDNLIEERFQRTISRDELNVPILFLAPEIFGQKVWLHFSQQDDPCHFASQIATGTVLLDMERF
ncbi:MAG: DUF6639 family protein [Pseudomonadota bacterium]